MVRITRVLRQVVFTSPVVLCLLATGGCSNSFSGAPERVRGVDAEIALLEPLIGDERLMLAYASAPTEAVRNEIIWARLYAVDLRFSQFETALMRERRDVGFLTTLTELAVGATGAFVPEKASQILSALSAGIAGASASFDKEILIDQTIQALLTQMRANRAQVANRIVSHMKLPVADYPLTRALKDIEDYYQGGTLVGALVGINENAGLAVAVAEGRAQATPDIRPTDIGIGTPLRDDEAPIPTPLPRTVCGNAQTTIELTMEPQVCEMLQRALCVGEDGVFGSQTREAFRVVEASLGLPPNGQIDPDDSWYSDLIGLAAMGSCNSRGFLSTHERVTYDPAFDRATADSELRILRNSLDAFWQGQLGVAAPQIPATPTSLADLRDAINATQVRLNQLEPTIPAHGPVTLQLLEAMDRFTP